MAPPLHSTQTAPSMSIHRPKINTVFITSPPKLTARIRINYLTLSMYKCNKHIKKFNDFFFFKEILNYFDCTVKWDT